MADKFRSIRNDEKPLYLSIHIAMIDAKVLSILERIIYFYKQSGLWYLASKILLGLVGRLSERDLVIRMFEGFDGDIHILVMKEDASHYERDTLHALHGFLHLENREAYVFYCHTKGVTRCPSTFPGIRKWVDAMLFFNCMYFPRILYMLDNNKSIGACGVDKHLNSREVSPPNNYHFSGNFWWSSSEYIKSLSVPIGTDYLAPEEWIGQGPLDIFDAFHFIHGNWYFFDVQHHWDYRTDKFSYTTIVSDHIDIDDIAGTRCCILFANSRPRWFDTNSFIEWTKHNNVLHVSCILGSDTADIDYTNDRPPMWVCRGRSGKWHTCMEGEPLPTIAQTPFIA